MTLAEHRPAKPNGHTSLFSTMREQVASLRGSANDALQRFARAPRITLPIGKARIEVATDRVRARPAVTPTLSGMIGLTAISLGAAGLLFPRSLSRALDLRAPAPAVQALFGARELWSGYSLVGDPTKSGVLWARVAGDVFDIAALRALDRPDNARRGNARAALGFVLAVTALDVVTAVRMSTVKRTCGQGARP